MSLMETMKGLEGGKEKRVDDVTKFLLNQLKNINLNLGKLKQKLS